MDLFNSNCTVDFGEASLMIQRYNGELEIYSLTKTTHPTQYGFTFSGNIGDSGFRYDGLCDYSENYDHYSESYCYIDVDFHPTDLHYDGAEITLQTHFPECYTTPNTSGVTTLHIQGDAGK